MEDHVTCLRVMKPCLGLRGLSSASNFQHYHLSNPRGTLTATPLRTLDISPRLSYLGAQSYIRAFSVDLYLFAPESQLTRRSLRARIRQLLA